MSSKDINTFDEKWVGQRSTSALILALVRKANELVEKVNELEAKLETKPAPKKKKGKTSGKGKDSVAGTDTKA